MKVKRLMSGLFAFAAAALAAAVMSGCSTSPADWSVDVDFTTGTKGTAKVKVQNIDTNNFLSGSDDRLDKLDIYYAYSSEEKIANLKAPSGTQDSGNFSQISVDDVDGKISVTVSDEENAAFKAAPQNSWEKLIDFELPADAAGKEVWFRVVAFGLDSVGAGGISGYVLSSNYTESKYTKPLAVGSYYQNGESINFGEGAYINQFNTTGSPSRSLDGLHQLNFVKYQRAYGRQYFRFDDDTVVENGLYFMNDDSTPMQDEPSQLRAAYVAVIGDVRILAEQRKKVPLKRIITAEYSADNDLDVYKLSAQLSVINKNNISSIGELEGQVSRRKDFYDKQRGEINDLIEEHNRLVSLWEQAQEFYALSEKDVLSDTEQLRKAVCKQAMERNNVFNASDADSLRKRTESLAKRIVSIKNDLEKNRQRYDVYCDIRDTYYIISKGDYLSTLVEEESKRREQTKKKLKR